MTSKLIIYNYGPRKRWISKIVNPIRVISPRALEGNSPSGVDNFGYSPIQRAIAIYYAEQTAEIYCLIFELLKYYFIRVIHWTL
jgi:hypothetical protein